MHKTTSLYTFQNKSPHGRLSEKLRENEFQNSEFDDGNDGNSNRESAFQVKLGLWVLSCDEYIGWKKLNEEGVSDFAYVLYFL